MDRKRLLNSDSMDDEEEKILRLRAGKCDRIKALWIYHKGPLGRKKQHRSKKIAPAFQAEVQKAVQQQRWEMPPRADIVVHAQFSGTQNSPTLPNLLKFYIDLLQGLVFRDDRQVRCINATYNRLRPPRFKTKRYKKQHHLDDDDNECRVSLIVERLENYKTRLEVLKRISMESLDWDREDDDSSDWFFFEHYREATRLYNAPTFIKKMNWNEDDLKVLQYHRNKELQEHYLSANSLSVSERPNRRPRNEEHLKNLGKIEETMVKNRWLGIDLGLLPQQEGEGEHYRFNLKKKITALKTEYPIMFPLVSDIELEIVLAPPPKGQKSKDLDNILLDVASIFEDALVNSEFGEIKGFTGYVNMLLEPSNRIYMRILRPGAIKRFEERMESTIERFLRWQKPT